MEPDGTSWMTISTLGVGCCKTKKNLDKIPGSFLLRKKDVMI